MSIALVTQHAKRMRRIILLSVTCLAVPHFSTLLHKRHDFRKTVIEKNVRFDFVYNLVWNIFHSKKN
jgi:endonuclease/exonuclease/phosphatase (EEP) superfamily protein YafD